MEVPTGWVQVLRGPRPPSQKWPMAQPVQRPRQPQVSPVPAGPRAPTVRVSPDGNREAARLKVVKFQQALAVMADTDGVAVECLKAELEKAKKGLPETPARCRGRRVPEVHYQVREAHCRVGPRARVGEVRVDQCQGTSAEVGDRAVSSRGRGTSSRRLEGPDGSVASTSEFFARRTGPGSSQPCREASGGGARSITCQWGHSTNAHSGSCRVGQLDAGSSGGAPECDEFGRPTPCGGSQHEIGRRRITDGSLDRWNGDVKAKLSVAEAIRHQCGLTGVRVGEADNPGPSRRRRTQRVRALPWVWDSDSELEDDHRNVVQRVDPPPDVVDALEQDVCEPAMVPADPNVEVGRQCNEDFQESTEEIGDLTRVDSDEEPVPRSHSGIGCLQGAREVFHMESDVDDELPLSHARCSVLPSTSHDVPTTEVDPSSDR